MQAAGQPPSGRDISTAGRAQDVQMFSAWSTRAELKARSAMQEDEPSAELIETPPNLPLSRRLKEEEAGDKVDGEDVDQLSKACR